MSVFDGSSALANMGINPMPQGTLEEIRKEGLDPGKITCCAPPSPGVRPCPVHESCQFHLKARGGFKFVKGPRNVGYYHRTHEGQQREDYMPCHAFVRVMQSRMIAGMIAKQNNQAHEIIRIVAQEGEMIRRKITRQVDPNDRRADAPWETIYETIPVPAHPRPGDRRDLSYEQQLWLDEMARQRDEEGEIVRLPDNAPVDNWAAEEVKVPDVPLSEPESGT